MQISKGGGIERERHDTKMRCVHESGREQCGGAESSAGVAADARVAVSGDAILADADVGEIVGRHCK